MKKLLVIGVLMSVMLVGCGTQKETTAVGDSTISNVVAEAVTEVLTETTEAIEETTEAIEETTEETTVVEETETETVVEETTETETVVEETTEVVEEPVPVEEVPAPVAEAPAEEEPAPAPATTGSTTWDVWCPTPGMSESLQQTAASMGLTVTIVPTYTDGYDVTINTTDAALVNAFYEAIACWGDSTLK